jgi:DNA-directed RNA polymerase II subunit RPB11
MANSAIFTFHKEDHTLGNLLRSRLLTNPHVTFAGYKVSHPLVPDFDLRVQTTDDIKPRDAVIEACKEIVEDLATLSREFQKEWELRKHITQEGARRGDL